MERGQAALMGMQVMPNDSVVSITSVTSATVDANVTRTLKVFEQVVHCITGATYTITVSLPSVAAAKGKFYTVKLITDNGQNVTVQDQDDSYDWAATGDLTLSTATDFGIFFSDGHKWYELQSQTT